MKSKTASLFHRFRQQNSMGCFQTHFPFSIVSFETSESLVYIETFHIGIDNFAKSKTALIHLIFVSVSSRKTNRFNGFIWLPGYA
jgi:hypothetical protein